MPKHQPRAATSDEIAAAERLLHAARSGSRYARRLLEHPPAAFTPASLLKRLDTERIRELLHSTPSEDEAGLWRALRQCRQTVMLHLVARDLGGMADLAEVMHTITALAEESLRLALSRLEAGLQAIFGPPIGAHSAAPQRLQVVGMGKLGGGELNVSSDIDLIFLYPEEGETQGPRIISNQEYFTRLGRKLIAALAELTADGQVFRVDMRLRPYGDSGPLVMSHGMLENYLHAQGREWERYAWVKARLVCGADEQGLMELVTPFVYRRHLDFSAIASLRELHAQIRAEVARKELQDNIKLGPGGIREIEFIVQVFQLIRGGREPRLRHRSTLLTLQQLDALKLLPAQTVDELHSAYAFLRNLEHRLQYLDDAQTQTLPHSEEDQALIAGTMGCADYATFCQQLQRHRALVTSHFEAIFSNGGERNDTTALSHVWRGSANEDECLATLAQSGYRQPQTVLKRLREMQQSAAHRRMAASTQTRIEQLVPRVLETAATFEHPDRTLERLARVLESIGRRESYLALLLEYPAALKQLARLASASPWAADYLAQHPALLDELISAQVFEAPDWNQLAAALAHELDALAGNPEQQMDILRHFKQVQTLRLLSQDLSGALPLETLSDHLSDLAGVILEQVLRLAWLGLRIRHRETPCFAVIGYGKLGGKELGYASDLDLIFLYDDTHADASEIYARLAQRMNTWLNSLTGAGVLYETDLRLRPNGASGLLVSQLDAFRDYQFNSAWVFEHQALTRARFVAGDTGIGERFEALRIELLRMPRDVADLRAEVVAMRQRMLEGHPNTSGSFDLKHDRGGIVDVEFIVQFLVLGHAYRHPELTGNIGNLALLRLAGRLGLIAEDAAEAVHHSYREFRRLQHQLRLQGETYARVEKGKVADLVEPVLDLWERTLGTTVA